VYNETSRLVPLEVMVLSFTTQIRIERPVELVFDFVADPEHLPAWNPQVRSVRPTSVTRKAVGATYAMERELPAGPTANVLEVVDRSAPGTFALRAASGPTRFVHRYRFVPDPDGTATVLRLDAEVDVGAFVALSGSLAHRVALGGVESNLRALKRVLEAG
jgi:ligand-binding SRPBCC domain-containing protein